MKVFGRTIGSSAFAGVVLDMLLCFTAMLLAASTLTSRYATIPRAVPELPLILIGGAVFSLVMALTYALAGLYRPSPIRFGMATVRTLAAVVVGGYVTSLALRSVADRGYIEQLVPAAIVYLGVGLILVRGALFAMRSSTVLPRVLIVGAGAEARNVANDLRRSGRAARDVVGLYATCEPGEASSTAVDDWRVFPRELPLEQLVRQHRIDEIIVAVHEQRGGHVPMDQLLACRIAGVPVLDVAAFVERTRSEVPIDSLKGSWLVYGHGFVQGKVRTFLKRLFDVVGSAVLLVLLAPVMLITLMAIRLDSPGPVIYRQPRVGRGGKTFMCIKFRSMRCYAENDGVARWATKNDSRVTAVGTFIRKTRIDELPQLWSVLRGEMSLVGPRPERPEFVRELRDQIPFYDIRHTVKPGVTGWAQVRFHYGATLEDARRKHQFDLYYLKNNSIFLDLLVLIETVSVVAFREGQ